MSSRPPTGTLWTRAEVFMTSSFAKEWSNIFWFQQSAAVGYTNYQSAADQIYSTINAALSVILTTGATIEGAQVVFNDGAGSYGIEVYNEISGSVAGNAVPEDVSAVVQRVTATPGKSGRGRIFFAGLPESFVNGSYLSTLGETAFGGLQGTLQAGIVSGGITFTPYFFSPKTGAFLPTTAFNYVSLLATNRKRRPRF